MRSRVGAAPVWLWVYSELREKRIGPEAELELSRDSLQGGLCVSSSLWSSWTRCLKIADPVQLLLGSRQRFRRSGMVSWSEQRTESLGNWGWIVWLRPGEPWEFICVTPPQGRPERGHQDTSSAPCTALGKSLYLSASVSPSGKWE